MQKISVLIAMTLAVLFPQQVYAEYLETLHISVMDQSKGEKFSQNNNLRAILIVNEGPQPIKLLSISPSSYYGWGCGPSWVAWTCDRLNGTRIPFLITLESKLHLV